MIITTEDLRRAKEANILTENVRKFFQEVYGEDDIDDLIKSDFETRKIIVETVISDITGEELDNIIYIEYPGRYEELDKIVGNEEYKEELRDGIDASLRRVGPYGATIIDFTQHVFQLLERGDDVPDILLEDLRIIMFNLKAFEKTRYYYNREANPLWTLVHEVFHNYPKKETNETKVQKLTFDWLLEHGYDGAVLATVADQLIDKALGEEDDYNIVDYMLEELNRNAPELYYSFLVSLEELFRRKDITDTVSGRTAEIILNYILQLTEEFQY